MNEPPPRLPAPESPLLLEGPDEPLLLAAPKPRPAKAVPPKRKPYLIAAIALLVLLLVGWFFHHLEANKAKAANERARDRIPTVAVIEARRSASSTELLLPGSITPITEASLFARSSGYLRARYVDIGDTVHRGQVLAEIDSPDLDQQVAQGRAAVAQARQQFAQAETTVVDARARVDLARVTYDRAAVLGRDDAVAQQEVDQRRQELDTARATLASNIANVGAARDNIRAAGANAQRLVVLQDFEKLRAPFDGVVTARSVDVGALIGPGGSSMGASSQPSNASSSGGTGSSASSSSSSSSSTTSSAGGSSGGTTTGSQGGELFRIGRVDRLRVFVNVPQSNASDVGPDHDASVFVQGFPDAFAGRVTRNAKSLDPSARTLLTEVQIDNARRLLMPGMYAQVRFESPRNDPPVLVPGEAVIARADGLSIAVVEDLRPEDRRRLPKKPPKDDDANDQGGSKKGDEQGGSGDDAKGGSGKQAKTGAAGEGRSKKGQAEDESKKGGDAKGGDAKGGDSKGGDAKGGDAKGGDEASRDPNDAKRIRLQPVRTGRDYGTEIEIVQGLAAGTLIVANPSDVVVDDALVMPKKRQPAAQGSGKKGQGGQGGDNGSKDTPQPGIQSPSMVAPTKGRS